MRILLDHNVPAPLRYWLIGHQVDTAYELGWAEVSNGELLRSAEAVGFDLMITTNDWTHIRNSKSTVLQALSGIAPGAYIEVVIPLR